MIETAYQKAIEVMRLNQTNYGFSATVEKIDNYYSIWARDHSICAIAACLTGDKELIKTSKKGVLYLLRNQNDHGQIPSYIEIENRKKVYGGLGTITAVDSDLWVPIAAHKLYMVTKDKRFVSDINMGRYQKLYRQLKAFDSNDCGLLEVPKAGDWADIFNRSYHVLYDQCLYYQALRSLQSLFESNLEFCKDPILRKKTLKRIRWIKKRRPRVKKRINSVLWFTKENIEGIMREYMTETPIEEKNYGYYQSHIIPFEHYWARRFDTFGNILAILTGVANKKKSNSIMKHASSIAKPHSIKSLFPPVMKRDKDWEPIYNTREKPYTYHNGAIWPMINGFYINALVKIGKEPHLEDFANLLRKNDWGFYEHYHGKTGKPMGRRNQTWSAAGFIIAYHSVKNNIRLFPV